MTIFTLLILIFILPLAAQEKSEGNSSQTRNVAQPNWATKVIQVKYADVASLAEIIHPFSVTHGVVSFNRDFKVLTITGDPETLNFMEETIKRFDVPPPSTKNIEITAYLLLGEESASGARVSNDLEGVIKQLKNVFPYSSFSLLDTFVIRCREGKGGKASGIAPSKSTEQSVRTLITLEFDAVRLWEKGNSKSIRIDQLRMGEKIPLKSVGAAPNAYVNYTYVESGINTDIDLLEGQKIVVGKSTVDGSNNAIFLVLSARVVD